MSKRYVRLLDFFSFLLLKHHFVIFDLVLSTPVLITLIHNNYNNVIAATSTGVDFNRMRRRFSIVSLHFTEHVVRGCNSTIYCLAVWCAYIEISWHVETQMCLICGRLKIKINVYYFTQLKTLNTVPLHYQLLL